MTVDLNRLREARWQSSADAREVLAEAGMAVLAAPTVWWCEEAGTITREGYPMNAQDQPAWCAGHSHDGCGWVVLVPVSGGVG